MIAMSGQQSPIISMQYDVVGNAPITLRAMADALAQIDTLSRSANQSMGQMNAGSRTSSGSSNPAAGWPGGAMPPGPQGGQMPTGMAPPGMTPLGGWARSPQPIPPGGPGPQVFQTNTGGGGGGGGGVNYGPNARDRVLNSLRRQRLREEGQERRRAEAAARAAAAAAAANRTGRRRYRVGTGGHGYGSRRMFGAGAAMHPRQALLNMLGPLGGPAAMGLIGNYMAQGAINSGTSIANAAQNADMSAGQRAQAVAEAIPIIGGLVKSLSEFAHALTGSTERLRVFGNQMDIRRAVEMERIGQQPHREAAQLQSATAAFRSNQLSGLRPMPFPSFDRTNYLGEVAFGEYMQRRPNIEREQVALREEEAARQAAEFSRGQVSDANNRLSRYRSAYNSAFANANSFTSAPAGTNWSRVGGGATAGAITGGLIAGPAGALIGGAIGAGSGYLASGESSETREGRIRAMRQLVESSQELLAVEQQHRGVLQANVQAENAYTQAMAARRQVQLNMAKDNLEIARQREQQVAQESTSLGMMGIVERQRGVQAAIQAQEFGFGTLTPEQRRNFAGVAGGAANSMAREYAESLPETEELRRRGLILPETLQQARTTTEEARQRVSLLEITDTQRTAERLAETLKSFADSLVDSFERVLAGVERRLRAEQRYRAANGGA